MKTNGVGSLEGYLRDASLLRMSMALNENDTNFARAGGQIIYLIDTNIILMFLRPHEHSQYMSVFNRWLGEEDRITTATLAAEFMLSGRLPGQHGDPALITPVHFEEVIGITQKLYDYLQLQIEDSAGDASYRKAVESARRLAQVLKSDIGAGQKISALIDQLPGDVAHLVMNYAAVTTQLQRLFGDRPTVERIDTRRWFTSDLLELPAEEVSKWYFMLHDLRRSARRPAGRDRSIGAASSRDKPLNLIHDATTLAMLERLFRTRGIEEERERKTRYVFITADSAIRTAVERFVASPDGQGIPEFTRHPREFAPLLNLSAMSDGDGDRLSIFRMIRVALDDLLLTRAADEVEAAPFEGAHLETYLAFRAPEYARRHSHSMIAKIDGLKDLWSKSAALAAGLSIRYLEHRSEAFVEALEDALSNKNFTAELLQGLGGLLGRMGQHHSALTFQGSFERLREAAGRRRRRSGSLQRPRAPLNLVGIDFSQFVGEDLYGYFEKVARGQIRADPTEDALPSLHELGLLHLFRACLFMLVELWPLARAHSQAAVAAYRTTAQEPNAGKEANYCAALAIRFTMVDRSDYETALQLIEQSVGSGRDEVRRLRFFSERAALRLFVLYRSRLFYEEGSSEHGRLVPIVDSAEFDSLYESVLDDLNHADDVLEGLEGQADQIVSSISLQLFTNIAAAWVYRELLPHGHNLTEVTKNRANDLQRLTDAMDRDVELRGAPRPTSLIYKKLLQYLEAGTDADRQQASEDAVADMRRLLAEPDALHELDRVEYRTLIKQLAA